VLQGEVLLTKSELYNAVAECEKQTKSRQKKWTKKQRPPSLGVETEPEDEIEGGESARASSEVMGDCIVVAGR